MKEIKKVRINKKTNRKLNLKAFIDSGYTDIDAFKKACVGDENLMIYTCLTAKELKEVIEKMKTFNSIDEQVKYLVNCQPTMNLNLERYNRCVESIAAYLKGYIEYNGFKMCNADGDSEDWTSEFWLKYTKICNFYRTRWFQRESLTKNTSVTYNPMLYKEFIYICRRSITGERKHLAFLATQNQDSSMFKSSLDDALDIDGETKSLGDVIHDPVNDGDMMLSEANTNNIIDRALSIAKQYEDGIQYFDSIKKIYDEQETNGINKKAIILSKIFLYKAGLVSPKVLSFIKTLSATYKSRFNISDSRVRRLIEDNKQVKTFKPKKLKKDVTWHNIVLNNASVMEEKLDTIDQF